MLQKGSVGIKGKNKLLFDDLPLYMRTLMQASRVGKNIIFSSDDTEMINESKKIPNVIPLKRPKELSLASSPKLPVLRHAIKHFQENFKEKPNLIIDLQVTSPLRLDGEIIDSYNFLKNRKEYNNLISISQSIYHPSYNLVKIDNNLKVELLNVSKDITGEMITNNYFINGSIFIWKYDEIMKDKNTLVRKRSRL